MNTLTIAHPTQSDPIIIKLHNQFAADYHDKYEHEAVQRMIPLLEHSKCFVDVGAHIGFWTILAAKVMKSETLIETFEANDGKMKALRGNLDANIHRPHEKIILWPMRLGEKEPKIYQNHSFSRLDTINMEPDLIKIDVEGDELAVIQGASRLLEQYHPTLLIEVHPKKIPGGREGIAEMHRVLYDLGYTCNPIMMSEERFNDGRCEMYLWYVEGTK